MFILQSTKPCKNKLWVETGGGGVGIGGNSYFKSYEKLGRYQGSKDCTKSLGIIEQFNIHYFTDN